MRSRSTALFASVGRVAGMSAMSMAEVENSVTPRPPGMAERTPRRMPAEKVVASMAMVTGMPNAVVMK